MFESVEIKLNDKLTVCITREGDNDNYSNTVELLENGIRVIASAKLTDEKSLEILEVLSDAEG